MKDKIFLALMEASAAHGMKSRVGFQKMDLSEGQPKVLYILAQNPGCVQKELAEKCGVSQPTLTAILERMIQRELVRREKNDYVRRKEIFSGVSDTPWIRDRRRSESMGGGVRVLKPKRIFGRRT